MDIIPSQGFLVTEDPQKISNSTVIGGVEVESDETIFQKAKVIRAYQGCEQYSEGDYIIIDSRAGERYGTNLWVFDEQDIRAKIA